MDKAGSSDLDARTQSPHGIRLATELSRHGGSSGVPYDDRLLLEALSLNLQHATGQCMFDTKLFAEAERSQWNAIQCVYINCQPIGMICGMYHLQVV